ncbi:putative C-terminal motor kinesin [Leptomonas pyrrhocoris]|uniref:Kinesin-like protein n=1 Tax=Leptomonas pyrrhocoris TaxID=157538 RepID=A0A0N0VGB8_LEPPY|nr:putative C-terminal motor kinesin [Leptomonas pyrrhocoris]KPA82638.1 putative C-terminal motor kinesin [Leptomonas pyrrhocoris]|eukprot:XP_015661077.1 putative C-terminal motor kinesin [Leptomonas pyrrhocoris]
MLNPQFTRMPPTSAAPMGGVGGDVAELIRREIASKQPDGDAEATARLVEHIRRGSGDIVLQEIRQHFKYNPPATQIRMMTVMDQCLINSGPQFAVMLSSEKWTDRLFKVAKTTTSPEVRDKIMQTTITWYQRYHTNGHQRLLHRFQQSHTLGDPFHRIAAKTVKEQQSQRSEEQHRQRNFANLDTANRNDILDTEDTILLQCQGDLASLEYALEHPHILPDTEIASECKAHKLVCMRMLESGEHERIAAELMSLIERFSEALDLFEAMTGVDVGEGAASKMRALEDDDLNEADSDDDDQQKQLRRKRACGAAGAGQHADAAAVMIQAQQQTEDLMNRERTETEHLRQQLEELRQKHEELQNKYKDAKVKNKEVVNMLNQYAERVEVLEKGGSGAGAGFSPLPVFGAVSVGAGKAPGRAAVSASVVAEMRSNLSSIRKGLREIRDMRCADMVKESSYFAAQISNAMAAMVQASENDRQADRKALQWTQELYKREMKLRKQYYNTIQELKGNIRVYCRVRPMLQKELDGGYTDVMSFPTEDEVKFTDASGRPKLFEFDEVYSPADPQSKVFEDTSPLIDSVVDGFNVCIFAYGQTGSGKTFTMGGGEGETKGINTRALERLFQIIEDRKETEVSTVTVSVLEIYIEQIRDLLATKKEAAGLTYEVKQGGPYGTYVTNLKEVPVTSPRDIDSIMATAQTHRSEGMTNMNEHSSRSHMLLYIIVRTTNKQTNMQSYGKLSLIDLAGSERLDKSGAEGQRLKEAVSINKSLSALGDVIAGLAQSSKHVPFRNSVLTFLLQDSMAGQAKVLMFVCVSPASYNASESGSSLLFASRARGVAFGQIKKNATTESKDEKQK